MFNLVSKKRMQQAEQERDNAINALAEANRQTEIERAQTQQAWAKVEELQRKIRAQTEADLLMVSMQIVQRLVAGEKKDSAPMLSLLAQQAAMQQNIYPQGAYNGLGALAGIGLSDIFGSPYQRQQ